MEFIYWLLNDVADWLLALIVITGVLIILSVLLWLRIATFQRRVYRVLHSEFRLHIYNDDLIGKLWWSNHSINQAALKVREAYLKDVINSQSTKISREKDQDK